jgi:hypothetical protein
LHDGTGGSVDRGATITNTLANLKTFLNASVNAEIAKCVYDVSGTTLTITSKTIGTTMNSYTLATSVSPNSYGTRSDTTLNGEWGD